MTFSTVSRLGQRSPERALYRLSRESPVCRATPALAAGNERGIAIRDLDAGFQIGGHLLGVFSDSATS